MSGLRSAVYVVPPLPIAGGGLWSPISCTLVYSEQEAVLVDTPITIKQTEVLIEWIERIAPGRNLRYIVSYPWNYFPSMIARFSTRSYEKEHVRGLRVTEKGLPTPRWISSKESC